METVDFRSARIRRLNYRKLRITQVVDNQKEKLIFVEGYIRLKYGYRLNLSGFIPYVAFSDEEHQAIQFIKEIILKLPVGVPASEMSVFEQSMMNALSRTLVMANPVLRINDIRQASPAVKFLVEQIRVNGYLPVDITLSEIAEQTKCDKDSCEADLWAFSNYISVQSEDSTEDVVSASAKLAGLFYTITSRPVAVGQ